MDVIIANLGLIATVITVVIFFIKIRDHILKNREIFEKVGADSKEYHDDAFRKMAGMTELLRKIDTSQVLMHAERDTLTEAVKEQTRLFHEFHADMKVLMNQIGQSRQ